MRQQEGTQPAASPGTQSGSYSRWRAASPGLFVAARRGTEYQAAQIERAKKHGHISMPYKSGDEASSGILRESISMKQTYEELAVQLANAESKCRELAAENAHARERHVFIRALAVSILEHSGGRMDWRGAMEDATELLQTVDSVYAKNPATDAFLAEVRVQGVEGFLSFCGEENSVFVEAKAYYRSLSDAVDEFAAQLRKPRLHIKAQLASVEHDS